MKTFFFFFFRERQFLGQNDTLILVKTFFFDPYFAIQPDSDALSLAKIFPEEP